MGGGPGHGGQGPAGVALAQRLDHLVDGGVVVDLAAGGHDLVEGGQGVAGRAGAPPHGQVERAVGHVEAGVVGHRPQVLGQGRGGQEPELEVLGAAADGGQHLLGVGGGQHEDHVAGGSSSVFSRALAAAGVSMWTSSRMYTCQRPPLASAAPRMISRASSMPRLEAASSSTTSREAPASTARHEAQVPSGSPSTGASQLRALARMRAVEVLPVPRGPLNR